MSNSQRDLEKWEYQQRVRKVMESHPSRIDWKGFLPAIAGLFCIYALYWLLKHGGLHI